MTASHTKNVGLYVAMGVYMLALIAVAVLAWRRRRVAMQVGEAVKAQYGGSFRASILILTTFASVFSGYTVTGVPAEAALMGFVSVRWMSGILSCVLGALVCYPRLRRLSAARGYQSPNDFIFDRYRSQVLRFLCSLCACVPQFFYLTVQLVSFAELLNGFTLGAVPRQLGMVLLAAVILAMELVGGMQSVVISDAVQAAVMIVGFVALFIVLLAHYGTPASFAPADCATLGYVNTTALSALKVVGELSVEPPVCPTDQLKTLECAPFGCMVAAKPAFFVYPNHVQQCSIFFFVINMIAFPLNPHMVQRVYIAASDASLRTVFIVLSFAGFLAYTPGMLAGFVRATFGKSWPLSSQQMTAFAAVGNELMEKGPFEYGLVALLICSSLAAIMSTADSVVLGVANTLSIDIFQGLLAPTASPGRVVLFGTGITVAMLVGAVAYGNFISPADFGMLLTLQNGIIMQIVPAYALGLYFDISTRAVTVGLVAGIAVFFFAVMHNPWEPYVPPADMGVVINFVVLAVTQLTACRGARSDGFGDDVAVACSVGASSAQQRFGKRLMPVDIRTLMARTREPHKLFVLGIFILVLASTPVYRSPGVREQIWLGFPAWASISMWLSLGGAVLSVIAACMWRPGAETFQNRTVGLVGARKLSGDQVIPGLPPRDCKKEFAPVEMDLDDMRIKKEACQARREGGEQVEAAPEMVRDLEGIDLIETIEYREREQEVAASAAAVNAELEAPRGDGHQVTRRPLRRHDPNDSNPGFLCCLFFRRAVVI